MLTRLRELRKSRKESQKDMANYLGIHRTTYVKYETAVSEPDIKTLQKLADFFNVTTDYLLRRTDDPASPIKKESDNFLDDLTPKDQEEIKMLIEYKRANKDGNL